MTTTQITEFKNYMTLMAAQLGHLGDGRSYLLRHHDGRQWVDLLVVRSTVLCDYGTRWLREHGAVRPCGVPCKGPVAPGSTAPVSARRLEASAPDAWQDGADMADMAEPINPRRP